MPKLRGRGINDRTLHRQSQPKASSSPPFSRSRKTRRLSEPPGPSRSLANLNTYQVINATRSYPGWIPAQFRIPSDSLEAVCRTPGTALLFLGVYNIVTIAEFLATYNKYVHKYITSRKSKHRQRPWSFSHVFTKLPWQAGGLVLSAYFTVSSAATLWHMLQIWTIRPRVTWFIGNMARLNREWGYMNHALSSVVLELFICAFSTYFVGNLLAHT